MDLTRWPDADHILDEALARPSADRPAFVRTAAQGDAELETALLAVLAEAETGDDFLKPGGAMAGALGGELALELAETSRRLGPGSRFGDYEVIDLLGAGGMGEVYRARDPRLGREVALKVLPARQTADPVRHARLEHEARLLASLNHPRIGAIYDLEEHDGVTALVLELVEGPTLAERIAQGRLPIDEAIDVAAQLVDALEAAHQRGVVHRDLKPANIKITSTGDVKVLDFGIAKALDADAGRTSVPHDDTGRTNDGAPGAILGTASYISPERARGRRTDHRADIWAFGCVFFEMLTGVRAFPGDTATEILARVLEGEPEFSRLPVRTPAAIVRLLERTLRKDPARRLGYIGDARLDLDDARGELQGNVDVVLVPRTVRRRTVRVAAVALTAGLVAGAAGVWQMMRPAPQPSAFLAVPVAESDDLIAGELPGLAISPDGKVVVYRTRRDGVIQLVERSLDRESALVIPGSDGGASPFFSPDGTWIAFASETALMKVPVGGGQPVKICDAAGGARGSWADDGTIVFSMGTERVIFRVSAAGGRPMPVSTLDARRGDLVHESPFALPGARAALVTIDRADGPQVGTLDLASGRVAALTLGRAPQFVAGHLVFARDDGLMAVPFDPVRLAVTGEPAPVVAGVELGTLNGTPQYALSASGSLVYMPRRPSLDDRTLVWVDRNGHQEPLPLRPQPYTRASLSPDDTRIAVALSTPESRDIWIYERARGTLMRLTLDPALDTAPVWSPDGRRVAFRSERDGGGIFITASDGTGGVERLTRSDGPLRPAHTPYAFTPDGRTLLYAELRSYSDQGIGAVTLGSPPEARIILDGPYAEARPALSPDGHWLAYQSDESGRFEIYVRPYPNVDTARRQVSTGGGMSAHWSRDGRELFYVDGTSMISVPVRTTPTLTLGDPVRLFDTSAFVERLGPVYDVTSDNRRFLFLQQSGGATGRRTELRLVERWPQQLQALKGGR